MTAHATDGPRPGAGQGPPLVTPEHQVERAAGEFRRGVPVLVTGGGERALALAAETAGQPMLEALGALAPGGVLLLTHARAATLKIRLYTPELVALPLAGYDAAGLRAIADPALDLATPLKGPFTARRDSLPALAPAAVTLAKLAGLLPAALLFPLGRQAVPDGLSTVTADAILGFEARTARTLALVARARVPLAGAEQAELAAFRPAGGGPEHYAVLIGAKGAPALATPGPVLTRVHSECFTGDLLDSLKCDCGDQLRGAVRAIAEAGGGVLLYLAQEGRGIGLMNKLRAYELQDEGFDTHEANERLGFAPDERLYDNAARMLQLLGYRSVRLMTNNPDKVRALETAGITVAERVPHTFPANEHNRDYLRAKKRGGHLL